MIRERFVPVAIDQGYQRRQNDAEGEFWRSIASQEPRNFFRGTDQGLYACSADGTLLGFNNNRSPGRHRAFLLDALSAWRPTKAAATREGTRDPRYDIRPPVGGIVVNVTSKVLRDDAVSIGRDHLWIRKEEQDRLARGEVPEELKRRIACCHLDDNTRGIPGFWGDSDIRGLELTLHDGLLSGWVHLESGGREFLAGILGVVESSEGRVTRFDLVANGSYRDQESRRPFAVAFTLIAADSEADQVPPQKAFGCLEGYYR